MSLLKIFTYCFGGFLLTTLWIFSSAQRGILGGDGLCAHGRMGGLIGLDRGVHALAFGARHVVRLKQYHPCSICPITKGKGEIGRNLLFVAHAFGPVHATIKYRLPILISREVESCYPGQDIEDIPGFMIARFTRERVTIYIKDRSYQLHFASENQSALE